MPARFADTLSALRAGPAKMTPAQAIRNIEAWEAHVGELDIPGAKTLHADLGVLKRALQKDPIDGAAVAKVMGKLAAGTVRIAGRAEGRRAQQVQELGEALEQGVKTAEDR